MAVSRAYFKRTGKVSLCVIYYIERLEFNPDAIIEAITWTSKTKTDRIKSGFGKDIHRFLEIADGLFEVFVFPVAL